ncbi:hypothetical protein B0H15DRAFT_161954 [Mycena belliarum]|uniref:Uncharacterized protein n=1 Tax=Mycena belliarum TaxID=1033014 RepID=A0AAD6TKK0_9AGAR|nr:hypothetical protein B0H15DRAFT_161954 [Mycena belliae]
MRFAFTLFILSIAGFSTAYPAGNMHMRLRDPSDLTADMNVRREYGAELPVEQLLRRADSAELTADMNVRREDELTTGLLRRADSADLTADMNVRREPEPTAEELLHRANLTADMNVRGTVADVV